MVEHQRENKNRSYDVFIYETGWVLGKVILLVGGEHF